MSNLLSVEKLTMKFGGLVAIDDLSFDAKNNQITSIIGPNGAGKTTVFNCLTGFYKPTTGQMYLHQADNKVSLRKYTDFKIAHVAKVARTFQNIRLFPAMSVLENLLVAQHNELMVASGYSLYGLFNLKSYREKEKQAVDKAKYWLDIIGLTHRADDNAGDLPYGDQRKLEIVRAMCIEPKLLCLDEPAAGLNPKESAELNKLLKFIKIEKKTGILLIEHDMSVVMGISDHVVVLNYGKKIFEGKTVTIFGGGDSALDWAIELSKKSAINLVHRRDEFRGAKATVNKINELKKLGKIKLFTKYQLSDVNGIKNLESIDIKHDDGKVENLKTDFVLGFFGLIMQLGPIADWGLNIDRKTISVDTEKFETNQKGIYAVGDICTYPGKLKLILSGFHEGALAARACFKLARPNEKYRFEFTTTSSNLLKRLGKKE